jgi:hypothetical protein
MATKQKSSKKQRTPKTSKGIHGGGGRVSLSPLQRILIRGAQPKPFNLRSDAEQRATERATIAAMHTVAKSL